MVVAAAVDDSAAEFVISIPSIGSTVACWLLLDSPVSTVEVDAASAAAASAASAANSRSRLSRLLTLRTRIPCSFFF